MSTDSYLGEPREEQPAKKPALTPLALQRHKKMLEAGILAMVKEFEKQTGESLYQIEVTTYLKPEHEAEEGEVRRYQAVQIHTRTMKEAGNAIQGGCDKG